jgi:hypothetical protein
VLELPRRQPSAGPDMSLTRQEIQDLIAYFDTLAD